MTILEKLLSEEKYEQVLELIFAYKREHPGERIEELSGIEAFCLSRLSSCDKSLFGQALRYYYELDYVTASKLFAQIQPTSIYYPYAKEFLRKIDIYQKCIAAEDKSIVPEQSYDCFKRQKGKLAPGFIVTMKGLEIGREENKYRPGFYKTKDDEGTEYLIFKIDETKGIVYAIRLSKKKDKGMRKIKGANYKNTSLDRWPEAIVRVFPLENIANITGKLCDDDFERALSNVYNTIVFTARGKEIPQSHSVLTDHVIEERRKTIKEGSIIAYKDYSNEGKIRFFYVFEVDEEKGRYRTFELQNNKERGYIASHKSVVEIPVDFHLCLSFKVLDKDLKERMANFYKRHIAGVSNSKTLRVVSPLIPPISSTGDFSFKGDKVANPTGISCGSRKYLPTS